MLIAVVVWENSVCFQLNACWCLFRVINSLHVKTVVCMQQHVQSNVLHEEYHNYILVISVTPS